MGLHDLRGIRNLPPRMMESLLAGTVAITGDGVKREVFSPFSSLGFGKSRDRESLWRESPSTPP
jgi:hypothetical protein